MADRDLVEGGVPVPGSETSPPTLRRVGRWSRATYNVGMSTAARSSAWVISKSAGIPILRDGKALGEHVASPETSSDRDAAGPDGAVRMGLALDPGADLSPLASEGAVSWRTDEF